MTWQSRLPAFVRSLPTGVTLAALVCGMLSIYASLQAVQAFGADTAPHLLRAALLIMLAMILDGLDGNLARLLHATSEIGGELDTFVDLTAFGIAPSLLLYASAAGYPEWLRILLGCGLTASGAYRLSRFKVVDPHRGMHGFLGLPITACAATIASFHIMAIQAPASWGPLKVNLAEGPVATAFLALVALLAVLQVSRIRFTKPSKNPAFFLPSVVLVLLLFASVGWLAAGSALIMLLFGLYYVLLTPLLALRKQPHG